MKGYILLLCLITATFSSCRLKAPYDPVKQAKTDEASIENYIKAKGIKAVKDSSGIYYRVIKPGTDAHPTVNSTVTVNYKGELLNGSVFDSARGFSSPLAGLIPGWITGIPHIGNGGKILLLIPSAQGYGDNEAGSIPANSVLVFDIDLIGFTN